MRLLLAIDESENARRAVQYVGTVVGRASHVTVTLFHVLRPMPRALLEHGGSENPAIEKQLSAQLHREQDEWLKRERETKSPLLRKACDALIASGIDESRIRTKFGHESDIATAILEEAQEGHHDTIVVGRTGTSRITRLFGGGVTDRMLRDAKSVALWIIE
ncbi:MAG: hypothetical protein A4E19_19795 [Nitrospira sp. SG-bin1]|nr:MAG: hypothetical protein A4E19_19795 [Nitrospira sp. SG-bin1]